MRLTAPPGAVIWPWGALAAAVVAGLAFWLGGGHGALVAWAADQQQAAQAELGRLVAAARQGQPGVVWGLIGASALYGLAHAAGPGHGKFLLGGAGLATAGSARALAGIALASALAQGLTAVALVYGGLGLAVLATRQAVELTDQVLTPISHGAIALIGAVLVWRGAAGLWTRLARDNNHASDHKTGCDHTHDAACGHRHGPSLAEVERLRTWRDVAALIGGIAIRPCTGAVMVLVIAWGLGLHALGLAAVAAMALGTGAVTAAVALGAVWLRRSGFAALAGGPGLALVGPGLQLLAGGLVLALSLGLLARAV